MMKIFQLRLILVLIYIIKITINFQMDNRKGHGPPDRLSPQEGGRGQVRLHRREQRRKN